ncbi:MAG TPA: hypothetical protein EYQ72_07245, partial [Gammaproteobacteria bacterium]|nr:hypothetical protein [Gammaproteobacteria bacterium]
MRTILQHKYFSSLLIILVLTFSQSIFSQFEVNNAISELSILQDRLNSENINETIIKDVRGKSLSLRASALRCVDEVEPLVETLKLEVEALEQINPEVDIEIYERLSEARNKLTIEDAQLKNCSLTVVRSTRIIDLSNKLLNDLTTELLGEKGTNIIEAITSLPKQLNLLPELFLDKTLKQINAQSLILFTLFLILGFSFGFFIGDQIKKIQYYEILKSLDRGLILNLRALFKPFGRVQAPIIFGSLGIAAAASLSLSISISESWIIRLAISPFLVTVLNVFNNWVTGSFSPTKIEGEKKKDAAQTLKQK